MERKVLHSWEQPNTPAGFDWAGPTPGHKLLCTLGEQPRPGLGSLNQTPAVYVPEGEGSVESGPHAFLPPNSQGGLRQVMPPCASAIFCHPKVASVCSGPGIQRDVLPPRSLHTSLSDEAQTTSQPFHGRVPVVSQGLTQPGFSTSIFLKKKQNIARISDSVASKAWEEVVTGVTQISREAMRQVGPA